MNNPDSDLEKRLLSTIDRYTIKLLLSKRRIVGKILININKL